MRRSVTGTAAALASMAVLTLAMLPLRSHLSIATTALILVVPVVIGVVSGGFTAGALSVAAGFLVYDFFFIPPYLTLLVGAPQNWAALGVYAAVMLPVAHVVGGMNAARAKARRQEKEIRELFGLSDLLVEEKPLDELLSVIVTTLAGVFSCPQVALFLPRDGRLQAAASAGPPFAEDDLRRVLPAPGELGSHSIQSPSSGGLLVLALSAAGRPAGRSGSWSCRVTSRPATNASRCCCSPTTSPWPSSAPSCASRRCAPGSPGRWPGWRERSSPPSLMTCAPRWPRSRRRRPH
jgi:two-component system sensor histidine kinase KdpD